jgi:hypothetical protein
VAHRAEVVDLVGLHGHDGSAGESARIRQVAVVQEQVAPLDVGVLVQVVDAIGVEAARRGA